MIDCSGYTYMALNLQAYAESIAKTYGGKVYTGGIDYFMVNDLPNPKNFNNGDVIVACNSVYLNADNEWHKIMEQNNNTYKTFKVEEPKINTAAWLALLEE